ncbi:coenzyme F420-0:L-glutamate ligase [Streptomyces klenkii]|uniref:coenzyme F420-0:L-glutamate ligase n=1 Tax=Streptomyces klenkii TaxID=1420899 RepID=UPI0034135348
MTPDEIPVEVEQRPHRQARRPSPAIDCYELTSAGVDRNGPNGAWLLPSDLDASARGLRDAITKVTGVTVAVVTRNSDVRADRRGFSAGGHGCSTDSQALSSARRQLPLLLRRLALWALFTRWGYRVGAWPLIVNERIQHDFGKPLVITWTARVRGDAIPTGKEASERLSIGQVKIVHSASS